VSEPDPTSPAQPPRPPHASQSQQVKLRADDIVALFHRLYYKVGAERNGTWQQTTWMGVRTEKLPSDMWIYQEILHLVRPDFILETGTCRGGSALFFCQMMDLIGGPGACDVVTVDINRPENPPQHPRLTYLTGSSTDDAIVAEVRRRAAGKRSVLVVLDSDHTRDHVLAEMRAYHDLVTPGSYMIVEDSNVNGHPVWPTHGPGPMEAIEAFMNENTDFVIDKQAEKFLFTFNPNGYLWKKTQQQQQQEPR
jgi:cephalosporin hydroxylase